MKKILLFSALFFMSFFMKAQTLVFHENFDGALGADSVTSVPSSAWALSGQLYSSPLKSDSAVVTQGDTSSLITNSFSTTGNSYVILEFDQICKIDFFDAAEILVSTNNGSTWTQLTASQYLGTGQFSNFGNKFTAVSYPTLWVSSNPYTIPQNTWWKHETFDISSLTSNAANVKVKFRLRDGTNNGASSNYGWLIDNIEVNAAPGELIPPVITLLSPVLEDSVYFLGPYGIYADITDASGIDTALLIYQRNNAAKDTVGMIHLYGNTYYGLIDTVPAFSLGDSVCYRIKAIDNSIMSNETYLPGSNLCKKFIVTSSPPPPGCTSPVTSFPLLESFDTNFTAGSGSPSSPGTLGTNWSRNPSGGNVYMWLVKSGSTSSSGTGPTGDHTTGSGNYLYTESSYGTAQAVANLVMPCIDLNQLDVPFLEFYYHMLGMTMGELHVDIYYGGQWQSDVVPAIVGDQGNAWHKVSVNLSSYKSITQIRFRAIKGSSYTGDIAIDDVRIWEPPAYDVAAISVDAPSSPATTGTQDVKLTFQNVGSETLHKITMNWQVNQVSQTPFVWTGTLMPGNVADSITIGQFNFISGPSAIKVWTSGPNDSTDVNPSNDTTLSTIIACTGPLHGTFVVGGSNPDFLTLNDAVYAIENCGIDSPIVFNIAPGTYAEQLDIDNIIGASDTNTVTFQSLSGDSTSVILQYNVSSSTDNYVVRLNSASHIHFRNITVSALGQTYGRVFVFQANASSNLVENCLLTMLPGYNYQTAGFYFNNTVSSDNRIINNDISNGYYGIYLRASMGTPGRRNQIIGNRFHNFIYYGAYMQYQDSLIVESNVFANDTSVNYVYPMYLYYVSGPFEVNKNIIRAHASGSVTAMRIYYCDGTAVKPGLISNNMISCTGSASSSYGFYDYNSSHVNFYFNSINISSASSQNSRAIYIYSGNNMALKNNIISNMAGGYTYYIYQTTSISQCDYNNLYTSGPNFAYWQGLRSSFAALKSASGKDLHSISTIPSFKSSSDLHMSNGSMNTKGIVIASVLDDIDNELRSTIAPAIGADEKPMIPHDAGVFAVLSPNNPSAENDTIAVTVVLKNYGLDTLPAFVYSYSLNGVNGPTQNYPAGLAPATIDTLSFPSIVITPGNNNICVFTTLSSDTNTFNDTLCKYYYGTPLIDMGVKSMVNPDSGRCFTSTEQLLIKLKNYGSQSINMATNPVTIHTTITGPNPITIPNKVLTSGTMMPGQEWNIVLSNALNMGTTGHYHFDIWTTVNGDGDHANDSMVSRDIDAFATITTLPYVQDFENFTVSSSTNDPGVLKEGWTAYNPTINNRWFVGAGPTYTNNTGPAVDHTKGTASGKYMYTEGGYSSAYTLLTSPCINISSATHPMLRFWYHMYGNNINSLKVDVFANGGWHFQIFHLYGHKQNSETDPWKQAVVDLSNYTGVIRVRFSMLKSSGVYSDVAIDDVVVFDAKSHDAGVAAQFVKPNKNYANTGTQVPVKIRIENLGLDTLTNINVGYEAGNAVPVLENWTGIILPFASDEYEFSTKLTAPVGEISLCAFTKLYGDKDASNDTACKQFTGIPTLPLPFTDNFEGIGYFVSSGGHQQWKKGTPNKNIFTSAHSPTNAWVTSLNDPYMNNSDDYLYTPFFNFTTVPNCTLSFYHRIDAQQGQDGGYIEYSTDQGQTWINLGYIGDPLATNWYNANIGGGHLWSAADAGWKYSTYDLSAFNTNSSVQFRFVFTSNSSVNSYDGWMIDDFAIQPPPIANDAGIVSVVSPSSYTQIGNSFQVKVRIKNFGTQTLTSIPLYYRINSNPAVAAIWSGSLAPGSSVDYTFTTPYTSTATYWVKAGTVLASDTYTFNDTASVYINKDVALTTVFLPQVKEIIGDSVPVAVSLQNFGTDTIYSLNLEYDGNVGYTITDSWSGVLAPNESTIFYFTKYYHVYTGISQVCARVIMSGDTKASNNETCKYVTGVVGIPKSNSADFTLFQNSPNPFNDGTEINFEIPQKANVQFRIVDLFGRIIENREIKAIKGLNTIKINSKELTTGMYFYEIEYKSKVKRLKMLVVE
jgi:parallel beta-helix repeat protein